LATISYNCYTEALLIENYTPGKEGANDLMWFGSTKHDKDAGYDKNTSSVPVNMYHTCSWITFIVKGETATQNYKVTEMKMINIDQTANVTCDPSTTDNIPIKWTGNTDKENSGNNPTDYAITLPSGGITIGTTGVNVETNDDETETKTTGGNIVVIPQVPGKLCLTYTYQSTAGVTITEKIEGNKALDLALAADADAGDDVDATPWEPGKHYIYTITIKANEILIAPTPVDWTDGNFNVTVE
jgi:hypothetical protein